MKKNMLFLNKDFPSNLTSKREVTLQSACVNVSTIFGIMCVEILSEKY